MTLPYTFQNQIGPIPLLELDANFSALDNFVFQATGGVARSLNSKLSDWVNVRDFGAKGDGITDDTAAIQAAFNASRFIFFTPGTYKVTATLTVQPDSHLFGLHPELVQIQRTTAYGHTITCGTSPSHAGSLTIIGIWFNLVYAFNNGATYVAGVSTNILNKDPTHSHVNINYGQNVRIYDCWFYGMGYGVDCLDTTIIWVERCLFNGLWDANVVGLQDSTAGLWLHPTSTATRCGILEVKGCHIGGYAAGAPVNVTTPPGGGAGSVTVSKALNAGIQYGVFLQSCERFTIHDCYIGGQSAHCIYLSSTSILSHGEIHDNMLDGAATYSIQIETQTASSFPNFITIHHNTGVGYGIDQGFLYIKDTGQAFSATYIDVSDNVVQYYYRAAMRFEKVKGLCLNKNQVAAYNSDGATSAANDPYSMAGAVFDANCNYVDLRGDAWGGGINDPNSSNHCMWGAFFYAATNNSAGNETSRGLGTTGGTLVGGLSQNYPVLGDNQPLPVSYTNGWVDFGAPNTTVGYYLDGFGIVHLQGTMKSGTINTASFTLPVGYRPAAGVSFAVVSNNLFGAIAIGSNGVVVPFVGNNAYVSLDGINFRAA